MRVRSLAISLISCLVLPLFPGSSFSAPPPVEILASTPVGSWQERQDTTVDRKKNQTIVTIRTSNVGEEERDGQAHIWIETEMSTVKVNKKGKRKERGQTIAKILVPQAAFDADPANVAQNPFDYAAEIIVQPEGSEPLRFRGKDDGFMSKMMQNMGFQVRYDWQEFGTQSITTPAGTLDCVHLKGSGVAKMKILIKKIEVQSETEWWYSSSVPFGMVKAEGTNTVNGKPESYSSVLQSFGMTGATSKITQEPKDFESPKIKLPF